MIKIALLGLAVSFVMGSNTCHSMVSWNKTRTEGLQNQYNRLYTSYQQDLARYKNGTINLNGVNMMWRLQEIAKDFYYDPRTYDTNTWVSVIGAKFRQDCGGFNKKDRDLVKKQVMLKWKIRELAIEMINNPYFVENWKHFNNAVFKGIADFREPTGYDRD